MIECAEIFAPEGKEITINSKNKIVVIISRRELDKQIAFQAKKMVQKFLLEQVFKKRLKMELEHQMKIKLIVKFC